MRSLVLCFKALIFVQVRITRAKLANSKCKTPSSRSDRDAILRQSNSLFDVISTETLITITTTKSLPLIYRHDDFTTVMSLKLFQT